MGADLISSGIAAGMGIFSAVGRGIKARKLNKLADGVVVPDATYQTSPYAQNILDESQRLKNAQMPGMATASQNIMGNQANAVAGIDRNANSGSQALALLSGAQGNTNQAFQGLQDKQNAYSMNMLTNYNSANEGMTNELDKVYQDKVRKQKMKIDEKNGLRGSANANSDAAWNALASGVTSAASIYGKK